MDAHHHLASALEPRSDYFTSSHSGFSEQSSQPSFASPALALTPFYPALTGERFTTRKAIVARLSSSWSSAAGATGGGGSGSRQNEEEDVVQDMAILLSSCEQLKALADSSGNFGIGLDMRDRVDRLLKRVVLLKQSAEKSARIGGSRVPAQLIATFKGLQREHSSLENIVRLATEAGPVLVRQASNDEDESSPSMAADKGMLFLREGANSVEVKLGQGPKSESTIEVLSGPKYAMSTPSEGSSQLAAVRAEIERRVTEQLVKKQVGQPIPYSIQEITQRPGSEISSTNTNFQKVPSVVGRRSLKEKSEVDAAMLQGKDFFPRMVEAKQVTQSSISDSAYTIEKLEAKVRQMEVENARAIPIQLHEQVVSRLEKALLDARDQLSQITEEVQQKEAMLVAVKEKLMDEQHELSEKVIELTKEMTRRLTVEEMNDVLRNTLNEVEKDLKSTHNQVASLGFELEKREMVLAAFQEEQKRSKQEFQAVILSLKDRLSHMEKAQEGFDTQNVLVDLGSVKGALGIVQEEQKREQAQIVEGQEKVGELKEIFQIHDKQIKQLTNEVGRRARTEEVNDGLKKVLNEVEKEVKQSQDHIGSLSLELEKNKTIIGLLQEEWKTHRKELQTDIVDVKTRLSLLEKTQEDLNVHDMLTEFANVKNRLTILQESRKHEQDVILAAQQQVALLEGKGSDLMKRMTDDAEAQKQALSENVRTLVAELLKESEVSSNIEPKDAHLSQKFGVKESDVQQLENLMNDSGRSILESDPKVSVSNVGGHEIGSHEGVQLSDKRAASLETFFAVMGQLIRQELERMDATSTKTLPLLSPQKSGVHAQYTVSDKVLSDIPGLCDNYNDGEDHDKKIITLLYESSWNRAFVHYCADNIGWTEVPGVSMQEANNLKGKPLKVFKIKAARMEFVLTDGEGNWDRAPDGYNYVIREPGNFKLSGGVVKTISTA